MTRKLTLAMLISLSATSPLAVALGVGEVEVRSTLNAPLSASIPLTDAAGLEPDLIRVSIAGEQAYAAAGLARTPLAASVRLAVSERDGRLMLDITSARAIREPWLDLLLRFEWPSGQQLREVTLLLDPPDYANMPVLVTGGTNAGRFAGSPSTPPDTDSSPGSLSRNVLEDPPTSLARVSSGDTLWSVASRLRPDSGISMDQMMVALVAANPDVFPTGNINAMRAGFDLVVPPREAIASRSSNEAQRIVQSMNQAWANRGSGTPARVPLDDTQANGVVAVADTSASPSSPVSVGDDGATGGEEDGASQTDESATSTVPASSNAEGARLTLLTDAQAVAAGAVGTEAEGGVDGEVAQDRSISTGASRSAMSDQRVEIPPEVLEVLYAGDGELSRDARLLRLESRWVESQAMLEDVRAERDELQASVGDMRAELDAMRDRLAALSAGGQGDDGPGAGGIVATATEPNQSAEVPWWGALYEADTNRTLMLAGGGLAALLALWALVRHRRQRDDDDEYTFDNVQVAGPYNTSMVSPEGAARKEEPPAPVRASMPQAEAINEADIFIAYGRYDQARELLEAGLDREPDRDDLRLKLLMVHLKQGNREEATRQAERLEASGDPSIQAEVIRLMGRKVGNTFASDTGSSDRPAEEGTPDKAAKEDATLAEMPESVAGPMTTSDDADAKAPLSQAEPTVSPAPETKASTPPVPTSRQDDQGKNFIDYQPPSLDPSPAARPETPMQPSIEFTSSSQALSGLTEPTEFPTSTTETFADNDLSQEWEVEEVAFPPLDQDNRVSAIGTSAVALDEARALLHTGETDRARMLLKNLTDADDATTREEAQSLLSRHDL